MAAYLTVVEDDDAVEEDDAPLEAEAELGLPSWVVPRSIREFHRKHNGKVSLRHFAGRALPLAYTVVLMKWSILPCFMVLILNTAQCTETDSGQAVYYPWSWATLLPVQLGLWLADLMCFRCIVIPKWSVLKDFQTFICIKVPFYVWLTVMLGVSALHSMDLATDSAFVGATWRGLRCEGADKVLELWDVSQSQTQWFPLPKLLGFRNFVIATWATNYLMLAWAMLCSVPVGSGWTDVSYDLNGPKKKKERSEYKTCWSYLSSCKPQKTKQNHGAALMTMAECGGMSMVVDRDMDYATDRAETFYKETMTPCEEGSSRVSQVLGIDASCEEILEQIQSQARRTLLRVVMGALLANAGQLYTQIVAFGIHRSISSSDQWVRQTRFSISVGVLSLGFRLFEAVRVCQVCVRWEMRLRRAPKEMRHGDALMVWIVILVTATVMFILFFGMCITKFYMIEQCIEKGRSGIWLISNYFEMGSGCVALPDGMAEQ